MKGSPIPTAPKSPIRLDVMIWLVLVLLLLVWKALVYPKVIKLSIPSVREGYSGGCRMVTKVSVDHDEKSRRSDRRQAGTLPRQYRLHLLPPTARHRRHPCLCAPNPDTPS